jgi:putative transposase
LVSSSWNWIFFNKPAASRGKTPADRRVWRKAIYAVIEAMTGVPQGELTVARLCAISHLGRAGYYRHFRASAPRQEETSVRDAIQRIALKNRFSRQSQTLVNHKRIQRPMRQDNLLCLRKRPFVPVTTDSQHGSPVVPNLARSMLLTGLDQLWVADITYVRMLEEFAYLAIVLYAFSRRVIGRTLETHLQASLAIAALNMALDTRHPAHSSLVHHSDRDVQYACGDFRASHRTKAGYPDPIRCWRLEQDRSDTEKLQAQISVARHATNH